MPALGEISIFKFIGLVTNLSKKLRRRIDYYRSKIIVKRSKLFEPEWYLITNPDVRSSGLDPLKHFLLVGGIEGRNPSPLFDTGFYLRENPDVEVLRVNPLIHYLSHGCHENRSPNMHLNEVYVKEQTSGKFVGKSALEIYTNYNEGFKIQPNESFSNQQYFEQRPDVKAVGLNPLWHFLSTGHIENFGLLPAVSESTKVMGRNPKPIEILKVSQIWQYDILLYVIFSPTGKLTELQEYNLDIYIGAGYRIALVCCYDKLLHYPNDKVLQNCHSVIIRQNNGYDFGAWKDATECLAGLVNAKSLTFINDSVAVSNKPAFFKFKQEVGKVNKDFIFATSNYEFSYHGQSYFMVAKSKKSITMFMQILSECEYYRDKNSLIKHVELQLLDKLRHAGLCIAILYSPQRFDNDKRNLTIHRWRDLLSAGFPFVKIQLISSQIEKSKEKFSESIADETLCEMIYDHIKQRNKTTDITASFSTSANPNLKNNHIFYENGAIQAFNPDESLIIKIPFTELQCSNYQTRVLAIIHCFYIDEASEILEHLSRKKALFFIVITTDTAKKKTRLLSILDEFNLEAVIEIVENRGRDVAPFLKALAKYGADFDHVLHLHTKKSPHNDIHKDWGAYLINILIGTPSIIESNYELVNDQGIGLVFPKHHDSVAALRNWGYNYKNVSLLLGDIMELSSDTYLEFPTSTMFWAKIKAISELVNWYRDERLDFEDESGQIDGTMAHAIERSLLYFCVSKGYSYVQVSQNEGINIDSGSTSMMRLIRGKARKLSSVIFNKATKSAFLRNIGEIFPVLFYEVKTPKRYNLLLPTAKPEKVYGGISTAIRVFNTILPENAIVRIVITSDDLCDGSIRLLNNDIPRQMFVDKSGYSETTSSSIVGLKNQFECRLGVSCNDVFFATAWWTADLGFRAIDYLRNLGKDTSKLIYLIQDYEPGFYGWSKHSALARATYERGTETIGIVNSEELYNFFTKRHLLEHSVCLPYIMNNTLKSKLTDLRKEEKEKLIVVYGRPSVRRNLFEIVVEAIRLWQLSNPIDNCKYRVIFAGEQFSKSLIADLINCKAAGKLSLEDYASLLRKASIGISLMESPHPSYPPLEMAYAGCFVLTNSYESKNLTERSRNITSISSLSPQNVAKMISYIVERESEEPRGFYDIKDLKIGDCVVSLDKLKDKVEDWMDA